MYILHVANSEYTDTGMRHLFGCIILKSVSCIRNVCEFVYRIDIAWSQPESFCDAFFSNLNNTSAYSKVFPVWKHSLPSVSYMVKKN